MTINLKMPEIKELRPKITVFGVGGAGGNAVNNMIRSGLLGCEFVVANTDSQALMSSRAERMIQMGVAVTEGLGAGSQPEVGRAAAEEAIDEITDHLNGSHMVFVTAGMGGGTGTGAAPIIARAAREQGILTVGVVTKPFQFEGARRMRVAEQGIKELQQSVDTLIVIPNQNLFRIANEKTTFADAFAMADQVLYSGVACITDLMVKEGLINLDFADVRSVMREMGKAMMGTGEASGERRATQAAEAAIANPLLDETSMKGARGLLISITGGKDLTLFEVDEAATRIREEVDPDANIILGATFEESLEGVIRVSVVATGIDNEARQEAMSPESRAAELNQRAKAAAAKPSISPRPAVPVTRPSVAAAATAKAGETPSVYNIDSQLTAAVANAAQAPQAAAQSSARHSDITITQAEPASARYSAAEIDADPPVPDDGEIPDDGAFIPPAAEAPPARMPRIEDFPVVGQRQLDARREPVAPHPQDDDRGPLSLIRRLANGFGRREDDPIGAGPQRSQPPQRQPSPQNRIQPRVALPSTGGQGDQVKRQAAARAPTNEGMYRPRQGDLDAHGRALPGATRTSDDELEIPAFLRRQAN